MDNYIYNEINGIGEKRIPRVYLWRQLLVSSGVWLAYFSLGLSLGAPTVLIPQLRKESNSTDAVSDSSASWISAGAYYGQGIGLPFITLISKFVGRKPIFLITSVTTLAAFFFLYFSTNAIQIFFCQLMQGLNASCAVTINLMIIAEYTSPNYRGVLFGIKTLMMYWGIWVSNTIGTFFNWRNIATVGILSSIYSLFTSFFWPESPLWLAGKSQIEECSKSHRWLKGNNRVSQKELELILNDINNESIITKSWKNSIFLIKNVVCKKEFYKPTLVGISLISMYNFTGKLFISIYAIDIIKQICTDEKVAYNAMLILDGVTIFSMYSGCIISKFVNRRTMYFSFSLIGIITLFVMSLYLYLINLRMFNENKYISIVLLGILSTAISMGPILLSSTLIGEIIPIKLRMLSLFIIMFISIILMSNMIKLTPTMFAVFNTHGSFLFYGVMSSLSLLMLYLYLPETKDKTLHEIRELIIEKEK